MRVLLVKPKYIAGSDVIVPRTLALLGAVIRRHGHDVSVFDSNVMEDFPGFLRSYRPDVVGISCSTPTLSHSLELASQAKRYSRSVKVVFGGIHPTAMPNETLKERDVDIVVRGESDIVFPRMLDALEKGSVRGVKGISFKSGRGMRHEPDSTEVVDMERIPNPDYSLLPMGRYSRAYIMTSRGCPFRCVFCGSHILFGHMVRFRKVESVVDEMESLKALGFDYVWITDDTFTIRKEKVHEFCDELLRRKLKMRWTCLTRVNTVDVDMLKKMKKAGCIRVNFGLESTDPVVLKAIRKSINLKDVYRAFRCARKAGMETAVYLMVGLPKQSWKSVLHTDRVLKEIRPNVTWVNILVPYPDTDVYHELKRRGLIKDERQVWEEYRLYDPEGRKSKNILCLDEKISDMSKEEILRANELLTETGRKISLRYKMRSPRAVLRTLLGMRSVRDVKGMIGKIAYAAGKRSR